MLEENTWSGVRIHLLRVSSHTRNALGKRGEPSRVAIFKQNNNNDLQSSQTSERR